MTKPSPSVETGSTEITRFNALKHGLLSRYTVLPWEDADEYRALVTAFVIEHMPLGPTEEHLVEELAGILWRKRRLRLAEAAAYRHGLSNALSSDQETVEVALVHLALKDQIEHAADAIQATEVDTSREIEELEADEAMTRQAIDLLGSRHNDAYEAALAAVREDTRAWWANILATPQNELIEGEVSASASVDGLRQFLVDKVLPWLDTRRKELVNRPLISEQAFGEALDPDKLERLGRYEVHLDRKLERTLTMLLRLKGLRQAAAPG